MQVYETLTNGIKIVEYENKFADSIAKMWNMSQDDWGGSKGITTSSYIINLHATSSFFNVYLAVDGEEVVGYCSLARFFSDAETLYIDTLSVRSDYQGKKIGKALVLKSINRTMELGFPRIDLFTWGGNEEAVPLYKKCGFMWEDREDSNHFANFIPSILKTNLFKGFFEKADWYTDSVREINDKPDGVKTNGFELFCYHWVKDNSSLKIGYERSGRQMRLIETDDFKIEFIAENHDLAFGLDYNSTFDILNKTGKPLDIKISGKSNKNISFDFDTQTSVTDSKKIEAKFKVNPITELLDSWQTKPCVSAELNVNGEIVTFGLGINVKYPIAVYTKDKFNIKKPGMEIETYINVRSFLPKDAAVSFSFPENDIISFANPFKIDVGAKSKTSIKTTAHIHKTGYAKMPTKYDIKLPDGHEFSFEKPLNYFAADLTASFYGESDKGHHVYSGPWAINLNKQSSEAYISHLVHNRNDYGWMDTPKFGKPYDDEFNLIKPSVKSYTKDTSIIMEATFVSNKFKGLVLTQIMTLNPTGIMSRFYEVKNEGETTRDVFLVDPYAFPSSIFTTFKYKGQITQNHSGNNPDGYCDALEDIDADDFDENWIFEANPTNPRGYYWSKNVKPTVKWGSYVSFEVDCGTLKQGQTFTTEPVYFVCGLFTNYNDFRNYVLQATDKPDVPAKRVDIKLNDFNPFVSEGKISLDIINNRETSLEGEITVSSPNNSFEPITQENDDELTEENNFSFELPNNKSLQFVNVLFDLSTYEKSVDLGLFYTGGEVQKVLDETRLIVNNGAITFKVDPTYSHACYSLISNDKKHEWLFNVYPKPKTFAWWNPFYGGIRLLPQDWNNSTLLKEKITAEFVSSKDNFGNEWQGVSTTVTVKENEDKRGLVIKTFFMTMPGIPLLCSYYVLENGTGASIHEDYDFCTFTRICEDGDETEGYAEFTNEHGHKNIYKFGESTMSSDVDTRVKLSSNRDESLYLYLIKDKGESDIDADGKHQPIVSIYEHASITPGMKFTSKPMFFVVTDMEIPENSLDDLERISFSDN